ncbi:MAG: MarR family transcriptional regulator [Chloroflexi bacterium]|nr:MAG: MarR family transcriptional regulator [Chloroflexota bacterium]
MNGKITDDVYSIAWLLTNWAIHRYDLHTTGEVFIAITIIMLDRSGHSPTVSELAKITGIPKTTVSRHLGKQLAEGYVKECIDPIDRRRRLLKPTLKATKERQWQIKGLRNFNCQLQKIDQNRRQSNDSEKRLLEILLKATSDII